MVFGLTGTGFLSKTLDQILTEIQDAEKATISPTPNTLATSVLGQINGIYAAALRELWEVSQAVSSAQSLDSAVGAQLENIATIVNATRLAATKSTAVLTLNVDAGTVVSQGSTVSVGTTGERFVTTEDADNSGGADPVNIDVAAESFNFGSITGLAGEINTIQTPVSGWTANAGLTSQLAGPYTFTGTQTLLIVIDGGITNTVNLTGTGVAASAVASLIQSEFTSNSIGATAVALVSGQVRIESTNAVSNSIVTVLGSGTANSVLGFASTDTTVRALNLQDASVGRNIETDAEFRQRIKAIISGLGGRTLSSILNAVSAVSDVDQVLVRDNDTGVAFPPPLNLPPHSVEVIADYTFSSPAQQLEIENAIRQAIFNKKAAGIETYANIGETARVVTPNSAPYSFTGTETLIITVNGAGPVTVNLSGAGVTAATVAGLINTEFTTFSIPGVATALGTDQVEIAANFDAAGTSVVISSAGTANATLGFSPSVDTTSTRFNTQKLGTVTDSQGFTHPINFTRAGEIDVFVDATVIVDITKFANAADARDKVEAAIVTEGSKLMIGDTAIYQRLLCSIFTVTGITDVERNTSGEELFTMDLIPGPQARENIEPPGLRSRLDFDSSRITVTTVPPSF